MSQRLGGNLDESDTGPLIHGLQSKGTKAQGQLWRKRR